MEEKEKVLGRSESSFFELTACQAGFCQGTSDAGASDTRAQGTELSKIESRLSFLCLIDRIVGDMAPKHKDGDVVAVASRCDNRTWIDSC